jgi:alpha-amylase/alpha-mannosidase (GH57 family)
MDRYICIHGHFYQPPRENPWLEAIELQDSAYPYHNWNERITAECYAPNSVSRILDGDNQIVKLVNNYAKISFNFGPTLLSWLEAKAPDVYRAILAADRESQKNCAGHGSAIAQGYNHIIMPLANRRDRYTQIIWGLRDFTRRFERQAEGMWLPETAVDIESLEILAELGIRFTILAPHQAARVRRIGTQAWRDVSGGHIDPTQPYLQRLPSGRSIAIFFYHGAISRAVAFEGILARGEQFADRLLGAFSEAGEGPKLVHIATDGESYGHHHRFGDMALAYALHYIESHQLARLTNYGEFLALYPAQHEVEIIEKTSWSCAHGIDRWWSDCGCNSGGHPGWTQAWRTPLRDALDALRDSLAEPFEEQGGKLFIDPWAARDDYEALIHDRSVANTGQFFARHSRGSLSEAEQSTALKLLELQRQALLMYTSCGWFFDEISGIETVQIIQFAARAAQLAQELFGDSIERRFIARLALAKSNLPEHENGRQIYESLVRPAIVDWDRLAAHYAVSSLFSIYPEQTQIYCYRAERRNFRVFSAGMAKLSVGQVRLTSEITLDSKTLSFAALHMGDHNVNGGVRSTLNEDTERYLERELSDSFLRADFAEVIRLMDRRFGESNYSLRALFRDEQRKILRQILSTAVGEAESIYRQIYEHRAPMLRFLLSLQIPPPKEFHTAAEFVLNTELRRELAHEEIDPTRVQIVLETAKLDQVTLDSATLEFAYRRNLEKLADRLLSDPSASNLRALDSAATLLVILPFGVDLWKVQNRFYELLKGELASMGASQQETSATASPRMDLIRALARKLAVRVN